MRSSEHRSEVRKEEFARGNDGWKQLKKSKKKKKSFEVVYREEGQDSPGRENSKHFRARLKFLLLKWQLQIECFDIDVGEGSFVCTRVFWIRRTCEPRYSQSRAALFVNSRGKGNAFRNASTSRRCTGIEKSMTAAQEVTALLDIFSDSS